MAELTEIASGLGFPEGPVVMADGSVVVVEIAAARITRVQPDGSTETIAEPGGGPNGAAIGPDGRLVVCNNGASFMSSARSARATAPASSTPSPTARRSGR